MQDNATTKPCPLCKSPGRFHRLVDEYPLAKCTACGFVYVDVSDQHIEDVTFNYGDSAKAHYAESQSIIDLLWFDKISRKLTAGKTNLKVLDIGCGNGVLLQQFQKRGCDSYGSDPSPWAQDCVRHHGYKMIPTIEKANVDPDFFDIITSTSTLEHVARPVEHLTEIIRILKPGGKAYFTIPNYGSLPIRLRIVKGRLVAPPGHCSYFTTRTLRYLFTRQDYADKIAKIKINSYGIPESYGIYSWFSRKLKRSKKKPKDTASAPPKAEAKPKPDAGRRVDSKALLVGVYYWCGRPFGLGDKLEATITKA